MLSKIHIFTLLALVGLFLASCQPNTPTPSPTCTYFPYTIGSEFVYGTTQANGTVDTTKEEVIGDTIINGYTCKILRHTSNSTANSRLSFANCNNGHYMQRNLFIPGYNVVVDSFVYLKDNLAAGDTWTNSFAGSFNGISVDVEYENHYVGTSATRVVNGQTFNNVINIRVDLYVTTLSLRQQVGTYNYYFAEGVGFIETDFNKIKIISYTIVP